MGGDFSRTEALEVLREHVQTVVEDLELQAEIYGGVVQAALDSGNCPCVTFWGFTDRYSWIPSFTDGKFGHALIFDRDYNPKPCYHAIADALGR